MNYEINLKFTNYKVSEEIYDIYGNFSYVKIEEKDFTYENKNISINKTIKNFSEKFVGNSYNIKESNQKIYIAKDFPREYAYSKSTMSLNKEKKLIKIKLLNNLDEIINNLSDKVYSNDHKEKHKEDAKYGFYKYNALFEINKDMYSGTIVIRNDTNKKKYLYDIISIKKSTKCH